MRLIRHPCGPPVVACLLLLTAAVAFAQDVEAERRAGEALAATDDAADLTEATSGAPPGSPPELDAPSIFELLRRGGWLMLPIVLMSILVVAFGIERAIGLRRSRILPEELVAYLGAFAAKSSKFDPRRVYRVCQEYPSSASTIIRTMLLKMGRPQTEVEHAVAEASQREADRLYSNVRTLNLAAAITPLLGLLGTVWGMIQSFYSTANLPIGANKAEALAEGIYVALVTTFSGLAVAIPAAVLAHFFEGRIRTRLMQVDELMLSLLPQVERYEGKLRVGKQHFDDGDEPMATPEDELATRPQSAAK